MKKIKIVLLLLILLIVISVKTESTEGLIRRAENLMKKDYLKSSLTKSIKLYEKALKIEPNNKEILKKLAEAYYKMGFVHYYVLAKNREELKQERMKHYKKSFNYGIRSLNSLFQKNFEKELKKTDDVAALYWLSCSWGEILKFSGFIKAFLELPKLKAVLERALEINEDFLYGGPLRSMAVYWASLPWWYGQDLERIKYYFEKSIKKFPSFIGNRALFIEHYIFKFKKCSLLKKEVRIIRTASIKEEHKIWDIAAKKGIEKLIEDVDWCSV